MRFVNFKNGEVVTGSPAVDGYQAWAPHWLPIVEDAEPEVGSVWVLVTPGCLGLDPGDVLLLGEAGAAAMVASAAPLSCKADDYWVLWDGADLNEGAVCIATPADAPRALARIRGEEPSDIHDEPEPTCAACGANGAKHAYRSHSHGVVMLCETCNWNRPAGAVNDDIAKRKLHPAPSEPELVEDPYYGNTCDLEQWFSRQLRSPTYNPATAMAEARAKVAAWEQSLQPDIGWDPTEGEGVM